ncbi:hypothetical protein ABT116_40915 [Streptomyces sp. NPDC002130]|uniref:hypothetical protein n=1 Tax=Streptomyces sp. NPDC002130 TaxID=3155568 RepID=UPI003331F9A6
MSPIVNDDLYVEFRKGSGERTRHRVALDKGARISTNTYFGRFAASYWQRWTTVTEVEASLRIESEGRFRVRMVASDIAGHRRILETRDGSGSSEVTLTSPLDKFVDGGGLTPYCLATASGLAPRIACCNAWSAGMRSAPASSFASPSCSLLVPAHLL